MPPALQKPGVGHHILFLPAILLVIVFLALLVSWGSRTALRGVDESECSGLFTHDETRDLVPLDPETDRQLQVRIKDLGGVPVHAAPGQGLVARLVSEEISLIYKEEASGWIRFQAHVWLWSRAIAVRRGIATVTEDWEPMRLFVMGDIVGKILRGADASVVHTNERGSWLLVRIEGWIEKEHVESLEGHTQGPAQRVFSVCRLPVTSVVAGDTLKQERLYASRKGWAFWRHGLMLAGWIAATLFLLTGLRSWRRAYFRSEARAIEHGGGG